MLLVGKVYPEKGQGKARGGVGVNATKSGQLQKLRGRPWADSKWSEFNLRSFWGPWLTGCKLLGHQGRAGIGQEAAQGARSGTPGASRSLPYTSAARAGGGSPPRAVHLPCTQSFHTLPPVPS